jgi:Uma2 family endonuclease
VVAGRGTARVRYATARGGVPVSATPTAQTVVYPDSDGRRMADNDEQFLWLTTIKDNLDDLYRDRPDVYVAGDHLIYAEEGKPKRRRAPVVYVAFDRPKRKRGSYKVWEEGGIFPQVVFEIRSPGDRAGKLARKLAFYDHYGAEEYYLYDPRNHTLHTFRRTAGGLDDVSGPDALVSPRLGGVRFDLSGPELVILRPDGQPFTTSLEIRERERQARQRADRLAAKLRALGLDPDAP